MSFLSKLNDAAKQHDSFLCLGLDPEPNLLPAGFDKSLQGMLDFNRAVIEATSDLVCAYKPNLAFYEAYGSDGLRVLEATLKAIPAGVPTIGDAKRGDVPNTARLYAQALYGVWGFDSVTVSPYLGADSLTPFLAWQGRGLWVLCRTSNPGAGSVQNLLVQAGSTAAPLYMQVLEQVLELSDPAEIGAVVGATIPAELREVRERAPELPLLIPGIGAQGGDIAAVQLAARSGPVVVNASRSVLYGSETSDPVAAIRRRADELRRSLNAP